ncbi:hypothetical protein [Sinobaca sp. H24]|uniref:hypothetical protein n=1 Tax=Sinobaca sp. H24 TaxID=2923376 RepID=UPI00207A4BEE|nr:hypothetical protein [Sinobaca sp. H24]
MINALYEETKQLHDLVTGSDPQGEVDREAYLERVNEHLTRRDALLAEVPSSGTFTAEEQKLGEEMTKMNQVIDARMENVLERWKKDVQQLKAKKQSNKLYQNPYAEPASDGVFFDQKN